jgi:hypothetical protein
MVNTRNVNTTTMIMTANGAVPPTSSTQPDDIPQDNKGQPFFADFYPDKTQRFNIYKQYITTAASVQWLVYALRVLLKSVVLDNLVRRDAGLAFAAFSFYLLFHISVGGGKIWSNIRPPLFKAYVFSSALLGAAMFAVFWSDHVLQPIHDVPLEDISTSVEAGLDVLSILTVCISVVMGTDFVIHLRAEEEGGEEEEEEVVTEKKSRNDKKDE